MTNFIELVTCFGDIDIRGQPSRNNCENVFAPTKYSFKMHNFNIYLDGWPCNDIYPIDLS